jgi:hypothetical protein
MRLFENDQNGQRESLANMVNNAEVASTPMFSSLRKNSEMIQEVHTVYMKKYKRKGHRGKVDGEDVTDFGTNDRSPAICLAQTFNDGTGVSRRANKAKIVKDPNASGSNEMASQIADSLICVKLMMECRIGSAEECRADDGSIGSETRGVFKWGLATAQSLHPVPSAYRPPSACYYSGTLAALTEKAFIAMCQASFQQRKGARDMKGWVGIKLKQQFNDFQRYVENVTGQTIIGTYDGGNSKMKVLERMVDILNMDTGKITLEVSANLCTDADTGDDTDYTTRSGVFIDPARYSWGYSDAPQWNPLQDGGGGPRGFTEAEGALICDNPSGQMTVYTDSDS